MIGNSLRISSSVLSRDYSRNRLRKNIQAQPNIGVIKYVSKEKSLPSESLRKKHDFLRTKSNIKLEEQGKKKSLIKGESKPRSKSKSKSKQNIQPISKRPTQNQAKNIKYSSIAGVKNRIKQPSTESTLTKMLNGSILSSNSNKNLKTNSPLNKNLLSNHSKKEPIISLQEKVSQFQLKQSSNHKNVMKEQQKPDVKVQLTNDLFFQRYIPARVGNQYKKVRFQDFITLKLISQQSYSQEYLTLNKTTNALFNIRILNKRQIIEQQLQNYLQESIKIHFLLSSVLYKNIQKIYTIFDDPIHIYIVLEPMVPTQISINHQNTLSEEDKLAKQAQICFLFQNILLIVQEVHKNHIVLRNLSFSSIKMFMGSIYLTVLDRATSLKYKKFRNSFFGEPRQAPHEVLMSKAYDFSYDMWSLGVLLYQFATGLHPFQGFTNQIQTIKSLQFPIPMLISNKLVQLISYLLIESNLRLSIDQCLKHELINRQFMNKHLIFRDIWNFLSQ